jgi:pimeloyl-ACP methyl ester carboxylesterase
MTESALVFGSGRSLVGIIAEPPFSYPDQGLPAVIFLNSGLVHHVGPNRLWVRLARKLAAKGFVTLRFDLSGIGDSKPAADQLSVEGRWVVEVRAAMDMLAETRAADRFVLIGNCSGASLAYATALADPRVAGAALVNPPRRPALRYFLRLAASNPKIWLRLFHGRMRLPSLRRRRRPSGSSTAMAQQQSVDARGLRLLTERDVDLLLISCEWDPGYDYFQLQQREQLTRPELRERLVLETIPGANHEFTLLTNQDRLVQSLDAWATRMRDQRWRRQRQPMLR